MGAKDVRTKLPPLLKAVKAHGASVVWCCDPMHGNTIKASSGYKTRRVEDVFKEVEGFFDAHDSEGTYPGGVSCHTTVSTNGFIFEGHIPAKYITQFLSEDHPNAIGLSVPGMPLGSPGMEFDNRFTPYDVLILYKDGSNKVFAEVRN